MVRWRIVIGPKHVKIEALSLLTIEEKKTIKTTKKGVLHFTFLPRKE